VNEAFYFPEDHQDFDDAVHGTDQSSDSSAQYPSAYGPPTNVNEAFYFPDDHPDFDDAVYGNDTHQTEDEEDFDRP
jgi:hypothetical protein